MTIQEYRLKRVEEKKNHYRKLIKKYTDLVLYWSEHRPILRSDRMNQSQEFINEQREHCKNQLRTFELELSKLK